MSSYKLAKSVDGSKTHKQKVKFEEPIIKQSSMRTTKENIDSRHRNCESRNVLDNKTFTLGPNPLRVPQEVRSLQNKDDDKTAQVSPEDAVLAELGLL